MLTILATIVVLGVLIFVHELGHFMTAKWADIEVPRFSIGFGPRIFGFKRGETEYVLSLLPLGGYVKMAGMEEMEAIEGPATLNDTVGTESPDEAAQHAPRPRDFESKSLPVRALVISAGVIMNLLFAFVVFSVSKAVWGVAADPGTAIGNVAEEGLAAGTQALAAIEPGSVVTAVNGEPVATWREMTLEMTTARAGDATITFADGQTVRFSLPSADEDRGRVISSFEPSIPVEPVLGGVLASGPAADAGLRAGDRIIQAGGRDISGWQQFVSVVERSPGAPLPLVYERDGRRMETSITPEARVVEPVGLTVGRMGVEVPYANFEQYLPRTRPGIGQAIVQGAQQTWDVTALTAGFLGGMVTGRHSARNVGGPIMIGQLSGRMARAGMEAFLGFMAILSVNLAVLNLLPIPVLDGGHLVFLAAEGVRGRPLSVTARMRATQVGFVLILMLMAWAIGNDLLRTIGF